MKRTIGIAVSLAALSLTSWAARRAQRSSAIARQSEPANLTLLGLALTALAASVGYEK